METLFTIENLKCGGCANTIIKNIGALPNIKNVEVDIETSQVKVTAENIDSTLIESSLSKLGYPIAGAKNSLGHKAKSFVSCAIGRLDA